MNDRILSRVLGVLGLMLLVSTLVTFLFGNTYFLAGKVLLGLAAVVASFLLGESGGLKRFFTGRAAHFGFFTAVSALLVVALLGAANWIAHERPKSWDLTKNQLFTLSEDSARTLGTLSKDVKALAFYGQAEAPYPAARDLLDRYAKRSPRFTFQMVDPYRNPELVKRYAIVEGGPRIVLTAGAEEAKAKTVDEQGVTQALVQLTRRGTRKVYFTQGHGEPDPRDTGKSGYSTAVQGLEGEGYAVETLSLLERRDVPDDAAVVIVTEARKPFLEPEAQALRRYADAGGHLAVFLEPRVNAGLDALLRDWGVDAPDVMVVDPSPVAQLFGGSPATPIVKPVQSHPVTRDLAQTGLAFPTTRALVAASGARVTPTAIVLTGRDAWAEKDIASLFTKGAKKDPDELGGPLTVAMAAERPIAAEPRRSGTARVIVAGDGEFFSNGYVQVLGNYDFFLNAAGWLAEQEDRITIRPRSRESSRLFLAQAQVQTIKFLSIDVLPLALLGFGLAIWMVRRSK